MKNFSGNPVAGRAEVRRSTKSQDPSGPDTRTSGEGRRKHFQQSNSCNEYDDEVLNFLKNKTYCFGVTLHNQYLERFK